MKETKKKKVKYNKHTQRSKRLAPLLIGLGGILLAVLAFLALNKSEPASLSTPQVKGAASLMVDQEVIDLGDVQLGVQVKASFKVTNVGDKPLRFTDRPYIEVVEGC